MANGEVFYGLPKYNESTKTWTVAFNKNQLSLVSPPRTVDFGLAGIMGFNSVDVIGVSTVEIQSPEDGHSAVLRIQRLRLRPADAAAAEQRAVLDDGQPAIPTQPSPANTNTTLITSISPTSYPVDPTNQFTEPLVLNLTNVNGTITDVGFFESGNAGTRPATGDDDELHGQRGQDQAHHSGPAQPDARRLGRPGVLVPPREDRGPVVRGLHRQQRQPVLNAPVLTIGDPPLVCAQGSSAGNFGTILLSHAGYNGWDNIGAANVAVGLDSTLAIYPVAVAAR